MRNELAETSPAITAIDNVAAMVRLRFGECVTFTSTRPETLEPRTQERVAAPADEHVCCVWTPYLRDGRSCGTHVPLVVVEAAWQCELARGRARGGFFHFAWRGEAWLGYGLPDGQVRGVYCPVHRAGREERLGYDPELALSTPAAAASPAAASPQAR